MNEVSRVQAHDMHAQDLAAVLAVDHLGDALALLLRQRLKGKHQLSQHSGFQPNNLSQTMDADK